MLLGHLYESLEVTYTSERTSVYRARRRTDGARVVMKSNSNAMSSHMALDVLRHEFEVLRKLDGHGVPRVLGLEEDDGRVVLILEDEEHGRCPAHLEIKEFLLVAIGTVRALEHVHLQGFLHLDIKPSNIVYHRDTGSIQLIDFGSSTLIHNAELVSVAGTMGYMPPEQIGRTARVVDERSDLYALGMTFYELLSGDLPFDAQDETEWANCHFSMIPPPIGEKVAGLPSPLAMIVHRLIQKDPTMRYQSASGVLHDLSYCAQQLQSLGYIPDFELGLRDYDMSLASVQLPLYERSSVIQSMHLAWQTPGSVTCVHGIRGTGKLELMRHAFNACEELSLSWLLTTCEQGIVAVEYLLMRWVDEVVLDEERTHVWRVRFGKLPAAHREFALGQVPALSRVWSAAEATSPCHDAHEIWVSLMSLIMAHESMLLVIDRVSELDDVSQKVLSTLITCQALGHSHVTLLHDGMTRPPELWSQSGDIMQCIEVRALPVANMIDAVSHLLEGASCAHQVAHYAQKQVGGHLGRTHLLIEALITWRVLRQHRTTGQWEWRTKELVHMSWPEELVELVTQDVLSTSGSARRLLEVIAMGSMSGVDDTQMTRLLASRKERVEELIDDAVAMCHVQRDEHGMLKICEPRVASSLMNAMSEATRVEVHQRWADVWRDHASLDSATSCQSLFEHERHVVHLLDVPAQHIALTHMMCAAEGWAAQGAHEFVLDIVPCALDLATSLGDTHIIDHRARLLGWEAEGRYYTGDVEGALELCTQVRSHRWDDNMSRTRFARLEGFILSQRGNYERSLDVVLGELERLGMSLPRTHEAQQAAFGPALATMLEHLERVPPEALHKLPLAEDERHLMIFELLISVAPAAFQTNATLFALLELTLFDLSVQWGLVAQTMQCLGPCGMIAHSVLGDHDLAVRLGIAAIEVSEQFSPHPAEAVAWFVNGACLFHLRYPPARVLKVLDHAFELCVRFDDHEHGPYAAHHQVMMRRITGHTLSGVKDQILSSLAHCERVGSVSNVNVISYYATSLSVVRGEQRMSDALDAISTLRAAHLMRSGMEDTNTCVSYLETAYAAYWSDDLDLAWESMCHARTLIPFVQGLITEYHLIIYSGLIAAARLDRVAPDCNQAREMLDESWLKIRNVAKRNPEMYGAISELLSAERARLRKESFDVVVGHYSDCARLAGSRFMQWRALAAERQADLWQTQNQKRLVDTFVQEAHELYQNWGGMIRCRKLEHEYRDSAMGSRHVHSETHKQRTESHSMQKSTQTSSLHDILDMQSVFKATQAIAGARQAEDLYVTLLGTMMGHAGAEHGSLILCQEQGYEVVAMLPQVTDEVFTARPLYEAEDIAHEVVMYCAQHRRHVLLNDASHDTQFGGNPSIRARHVQSLLCLPIVERGELLGVLYLENNLMSHAFSAQHLRVLNLLSGQAAVSLQNTLMFQNLEQQVQARTMQLDDQNREIRTLLDHLPHGVITLDEHMCIEPRYSAHMIVIMGGDHFVGKTLEETLFAQTNVNKEEVSKMRAVLEFSMGMPEFMAEMNWDHLPIKLTRDLPDESVQHLVIEWSPILDDVGDVARVMLTIRDETELLELEQTAREHARELEIVNQLLLAGLRDFQEFSFNARQRLNENHLMGDEDNLHDDEVLALLFRNFHTIKGNARLLGLDFLSQSAHIAEEPIAELREIPAKTRDWSVIEPAAEAIEGALHAFIAVLHEYENVLADNFGELLQENHAIDSHVVARLREEVARALDDPTCAMNAMSSMHILLSNAEAVSMEHVVKKTTRIFDGLSTELDKPIPHVELSGSGVWMSFGFGSVLHDAMIHLFRNAFDHGIESPEQRLAAGKPEQGTLHLHAEQHDEGARLEIWDDGVGLALSRLRTLAQDDSLSDDEAGALIFESGRTTTSEVSSISGRGVGMDAVRSFLVKQGCQLELVWRAPESDACGFRAFALRIDIPAAQLIKIH